MILAEAGAVLASSSLEPEALLAEVARLLAARMASLSALEVVGPDGRLRLVALAHVDPQQTSRARELRKHYPPRPDAPFGAARVVRTGRPEFYPLLEPGELARALSDPGERSLTLALRVRSAIIVPLLARGAALGALTLCRGEDLPPFDAFDLALAQELARQAATSLDAARLLAEARYAVRIREEFLSLASHELKTPLTALLLQVESLRRGVDRGGVPDSERLSKRLRVVARQGRRLAQLVESLLDISSISSGKLAFDSEPGVDLAAVARASLADLEDTLASAGCVASLRVSGDERGRVEGCWDPERVEQLGIILLSNAIKFGAGSPIEVEVTGTPGAACLKVRDRGIGIPPEDQARIFERFERLASTPHHGGFGVGLWIGRELARRMGGSLSVESEPGEGAVFTLRLPRQTARGGSAEAA